MRAYGERTPSTYGLASGKVGGLLDAVTQIKRDEAHKRRATNAKITKPSTALTSLGRRLSLQRCYCGKRITMLAKKYGDPYCSRVCMRKSLGIPDKTDQSMKEEVTLLGLKARASKG